MSYTGTYKYNPSSYFQSTLNLYSNKKYLLIDESCVGDCLDSGNFKISNGNIFFNSLKEEKVDTTSEYRHMRCFTLISRGEHYSIINWGLFKPKTIVMTARDSIRYEKK